MSEFSLQKENETITKDLECNQNGTAILLLNKKSSCKHYSMLSQGGENI